MHDQGIEEAIMGLLLGEHRSPWAVEEVEREIGDPVATTDALARLCGGGLVNRVGGFVFASRAAVVGATLYGDA